MTREIKIDLVVLFAMLAFGVWYVFTAASYTWEASRVPIIVGVVFLASLTVELVRRIAVLLKAGGGVMGDEDPDAITPDDQTDVGLLQDLTRTQLFRLLFVVGWTILAIVGSILFGLAVGGAMAVLVFLALNRERIRVLLPISLVLGVGLWALGTYVLSVDAFSGIRFF